jgi:hypothetical protein
MYNVQFNIYIYIYYECYATGWIPRQLILWHIDDYYKINSNRFTLLGLMKIMISRNTARVDRYEIITHFLNINLSLCINIVLYNYECWDNNNY